MVAFTQNIPSADPFDAIIRHIRYLFVFSYLQIINAQKNNINL